MDNTEEETKNNIIDLSVHCGFFPAVYATDDKFITHLKENEQFEQVQIKRFEVSLMLDEQQGFQFMFNCVIKALRFKYAMECLLSTTSYERKKINNLIVSKSKAFKQMFKPKNFSFQKLQWNITNFANPSKDLPKISLSKSKSWHNPEFKRPYTYDELHQATILPLETPITEQDSFSIGTNTTTNDYETDDGLDDDDDIIDSLIKTGILTKEEHHWLQLGVLKLKDSALKMINASSNHCNDNEVDQLISLGSSLSHKKKSHIKSDAKPQNPKEDHEKDESSTSCYSEAGSYELSGTNLPILHSGNKLNIANNNNNNNNNVLSSTEDEEETTKYLQHSLSSSDRSSDTEIGENDSIEQDDDDDSVKSLSFDLESIKEEYRLRLEEEESNFKLSEHKSCENFVSATSSSDAESSMKLIDDNAIENNVIMPSSLAESFITDQERSHFSVVEEWYAEKNKSKEEKRSNDIIDKSVTDGFKEQDAVSVSSIRSILKKEDNTKKRNLTRNVSFRNDVTQDSTSWRQWPAKPRRKKKQEH